jgi:hypothetical protein
MKTLGLLLCIFLFVAGFVAPRRSRRLQAKINRLLRRGERRSDDEAGKLGDLVRKTLSLIRRGANKSAEAGRGLRKKAPV